MDLKKLDALVQVSEKEFQTHFNAAKFLDDKADKFISAVVVILGFRLIDLSNMTLNKIAYPTLYSYITVSDFITLGISLILSLLSRKIQSYEWYYYYDTFKSMMYDDEKYTEEQVKKDIIEMYIGSSKRNVAINKRRGALLRFSGYMLLLGFVLSLFSYMLTKTIIQSLTDIHM